MKSVIAQSPAVIERARVSLQPNYLRRAGKGVPLRERCETLVNPTADAATLRYVERIVKFLLWARGGWKLHVGGPKAIGEIIRKTYSARGARKFDCAMMALAYGKKFEVVADHGGQGSRGQGHASRRRRPPQGLPHRFRSWRERLQGLGRDRWRGGLHRGNSVGSEKPGQPGISLSSHLRRASPRRGAHAARGCHRRQFRGHHRGQRNPRGLAAALDSQKTLPRRRRGLQAHRRKNGTCRWW
jgi:hypothetical protein